MKKITSEQKSHKKTNLEVFTVSPDLIPKNKDLHFNLYINSSGLESVDHFVCIWRAGRPIQEAEIARIGERYGHIYIAEEERTRFLADLGDNSNLADQEKLEVLKDGAIAYLNKLFQTPQKEFTTQMLSQTIKDCEFAVKGMIHVVENYDIFGLHELIAKLDFHDHYTMDHSIDTALYNMMLYKEINPNYQESDLTLAGLCGMFHDIGKIHLPNSIINATEALSSKQYEEIKKHPTWGKELLGRKGLDYSKDHLHIITDVVYQHHENFNGTGYPRGVSGEDINIFARMTSISDFFDAITTKRSYHDPLNPMDALGVIENSCGKKVDPKLFKHFKKRILGNEVLDSALYLSEHFDPCMPHMHLDLQISDEIPKREYHPSSPEENTIQYDWIPGFKKSA